LEGDQKSSLRHYKRYWRIVPCKALPSRRRNEINTSLICKTKKEKKTTTKIQKTILISLLVANSS
jgi:hypothetical protein